MKKILLNKLVLFPVLTLLFFSAGYFSGYLLTGGSSGNAKMIGRAESALHEEEERMQEILGSWRPKLAQENPAEFFSGETEKLKSELADRGFYFLLFNNDSLVFWSDNRIAPEGKPDVFMHRLGLVKSRNGWFEPFARREGNLTLEGLILIRNEYSYQNKYLENTFNPVLELPNSASLADQNAEHTFSLRSSDGKELCHVAFGNENSKAIRLIWVPATLYILSLLCFCVFIHLLGKFVAQRKNALASVSLFLFFILILRLFSAWFKIPGVLYHEPLFNPQYFASSGLLSSLGDLLVNSIIAFYLVSYLYKRIKSPFLNNFFRQREKYLPVILVLMVSGLLIVSVASLNLIRNLIINSSISFDVNDIFSLNSFSLYSFFIIALVLFSFFLLADGCISFFLRLGFRIRPYAVSYVIGNVVFLLLLFFSGLLDITTFDGISTALFSVTLVSVIFYLRLTSRGQYGFSRALAVVFLFAFICAMKISLYNTEKEKSSRMLLAEKLVKEQDHVAEHLFEDIEKKAANDSVLLNVFDDSKSKSRATIETGIRRMHQIYFNGYWSKYDSKLHAYDANGNGLFNSNNENVGLDYFERAISLYGRPTYSANFIFLANSSGRTSYLARIPIFKKTEQDSALLGTFIIELDSKLKQEESGFPDLLLSEIVSYNRNILSPGYSYARYKNNQLVYQFGKFPYYLSATAFLTGEAETLEAGANFNALLVSKDNYTHLLFSNTKDAMVVVSQRKNEVMDYLTLFSYLFAFFTLFLIVLSGLGALPVMIENPFFPGSSFSGRIQLAMMLIVLVSLLITGSGTAAYIISKYNSQQYERIRQRITSLLLAVQNQLGNRETLDTGILRNMTYDLMTLSVSSSADFNIYDLQGNVLFSTQPKIYEEEIISEKINPIALRQLSFFRKSSFIQDENIGKLTFISAYESIRNPDNKLIGYLGLPYFTNETELKKEISSFLVALVNIYVLLFAFALILSYFVTERITSPLKVMRQRISKIKLGKLNEPVEWDSEDEIGELILEYNRMVNELSRSAEMLARSERESAWREMAKQVAHEIKNPLTPMKLSVQHLQKAWSDRSPDMDGIVKRISQTLIRQIDTLSGIASEFSNFAQMPKANNEIFDLKKILEGIINLFNENENIHISFDVTGEQEKSPAFVFADKDQLTRVFTNLINNAMEAIPSEREGKIEVNLSREDGKILVQVHDNGTGINEELRERIFEPNFTTKNSGMGLGLAMVKNIVEQSEGRIWFETVEGKGTTFFVSIPGYK